MASPFEEYEAWYKQTFPGPQAPPPEPTRLPSRPIWTEPTRGINAYGLPNSPYDPNWHGYIWGLTPFDVGYTAEQIFPNPPTPEQLDPNWPGYAFGLDPWDIGGTVQQ